MNINQLRPAKEFAQRYGFKSIVYGPPGSAKTPIVNTAPRPVLLACEAGLLSMRNSNVPTWAAPTADLIDEFFQWLFHSGEAKVFDTVAIDSGSQMCDTYLQGLLTGKTKAGNRMHGMAAYGEMARLAMNHLRPLYYMQQKHVYLIAKEHSHTENAFAKKRPYFPGQQLPVDVPHLYDAILHLDVHNVPGTGQVRSFLCSQTLDTIARDRTGSLLEYEPPDFGKLVAKAMA